MAEVTDVTALSGLGVEATCGFSSPVPRGPAGAS